MSDEKEDAANLAADRESAASIEGAIPDLRGNATRAPRLSSSMLIPFTLGAAFFMEGLDSTIIATSLPQMARSLGVSATEIGVTMTAYFVSVSMWIAASGWLADRFESKRVFISAIVIFVAGSLVCGFSHTLPILILGRFIQGAGGALMTPIGRLILARSFPRDELVRAMSFMIIPGMMGPMLGPVIGGWITTYLTWRWIFFINLPLGFVGLALTLRNLKPHPAEGRAAFDAMGFVILAVALVAMQGGLEMLVGRVTARTAPIVLGVAAVAFVLYGLHARRAAPILDLRMFRYRAFAVSVCAGFFARIMLGATLFLFPLFFQLGIRMSVILSGVLMGLLALGQIAMRPVIDPLLRHAGVKKTLIGNSVVLGLLLLVLLCFRPGSSIWLMALFVFVFGLIQSVQLSTLAALNFSGMPTSALGAATSISAVAQRLAAATGITVCTILLTMSSGGAPLALAYFRMPVIVMAAVMSLAIVGFAALRPQDGSDLLSKKA